VHVLRLSRVKSQWRWANSARGFDIVRFLLAVPVFLSSVFLSSQIAAAQSVNQAETAVVFYADPGVEAAVWPSLAEAFYRELVRAESEYALPLNARPIQASSLVEGEEFGKIIQVHLIGRCDVAQQAERTLARGPLGWVLEVSGEIQPFVYVDCARVAQFLDPATLGMDDAQRKEAMARAISRIAIHEWIHIDAQTSRHENHGIRQAELTSRELIAGSHAGGR
jgi:hypothetical protein